MNGNLETETYPSTKEKMDGTIARFYGGIGYSLLVFTFKGIKSEEKSVKEVKEKSTIINELF